MALITRSYCILMWYYNKQSCDAAKRCFQSMCLWLSWPADQCHREFNNSQWPNIGWPWLMTVNFTSHVAPTTEYGLFCERAVFFDRIDVGYVNFLIISRRVSLADSFWSCFCCSSKAFSFTFNHPSFPKTLDLFLLRTHSACAQFVTWFHTVLSFDDAALREIWSFGFDGRISPLMRMYFYCRTNDNA